ncbi:hypothetical protein LCGC14_0616570 [marine sediment metagenome]|uniref:Uncharacterized protein n=1 Tax=marine sediment metagenome TaxID=412755 RepID=A0A0F9RAX3_9ZZZZ|nr:hypothetical protein [Candidatus Aminicenantes bacterium]
MESQIWRVQTEKIGSLEAFSSERDMESFLMNNPAIVGCWDPDSDIPLPALMRSQICIKSEQGDIGRMDLVGLGVVDNTYELRIFELKVLDIDEAAVEQLKWYLENWKKNKDVKEETKHWILALKLNEIDENLANKLVDNPVGVLVAPKFQPEAISKAVKLEIQGIRLARFRSEAKSEYFVIVENQIGKIIGKAQWSWSNLVKDSLIESSDEFSISYKGIKLLAKPDPKYLDYFHKKLIFSDESIKKILEREKEIREKANKYDMKWLNKALESLKKNESIVISNATGLCYLAFGGPTGSYWSPTGWWIHEKTEKSLYKLVDESFKE